MWRVNKFSLTSQIWCKAQRHLTKSFQVFPLAAVAAGFQLLLLQLVQLPASTSSYWPRRWSPDRGRHARCCSAAKRFERFSWNLQNIEIYSYRVCLWPSWYNLTWDIYFSCNISLFQLLLEIGKICVTKYWRRISKQNSRKGHFQDFLWKGSKRFRGRRHDSSAHTTWVRGRYNNFNAEAKIKHSSILCKCFRLRFSLV